MFDKYKDPIIRTVLWALLISSLVATITNLAWAFSVISPEANTRAAWFGAISFDGAVLIVSFYARRFEAGTWPRLLARVVVGTNTAISIYANVYRGIEYQRELVRISGAAWNSMPIVLGFALPLLALALAEILVIDEAARSDSFEKEQKKEERKAAKVSKESGQVAGQLTGQAAGQKAVKLGQGNRAERLEMIVEAVVKGCRSRAEIVDYTGIPKGSVSHLLAELYAGGRLVKNEVDQPEPAKLTNGLTSGPAELSGQLTNEGA